MLDVFEVQIIGSVIPGTQAEFNLDGRQAVLINVVCFLGIAAGAPWFGHLADRVGRRRLFVATLILYSLAAVATRGAPTHEAFVLIRFITALGDDRVNHQSGPTEDRHHADTVRWQVTRGRLDEPAGRRTAENHLAVRRGKGY